jgi:hypothetical protein
MELSSTPEAQILFKYNFVCLNNTPAAQILFKYNFVFFVLCEKFNLIGIEKIKQNN